MKEESLKNGSKVLIVDDSSTNRVLLRSMLRKEGYQVEEVENGLQCLDYCESHLPDVILLDIMMPEISGIEVCKRLRQQHTKDKLPIMMISTKSEGADIREGIESGANDYLTKPVDRLSFLARVESLLHWSASHRQLETQREVIQRSLEIQSAMGDVLPEALLVHDSSGTILYKNRQFEKLCDNTKVFKTHDAWQRMLDGAIEEIQLQYESRLELGEVDSFDEEITLNHRTVKNVQVVSKPIRLPLQGRDTVIRLWLWRDVTHTRELERRISQQVKLEAVSLYSAGVAHNFNNLMGGVLGATEILRRSVKDNEKALRCLRIIERAVQTGKSLTSKMSTIVRKELSNSHSQSEPLSSILKTVISIQKELCFKDIEFVLDIENELPDVNMEASNVMDVFVNVLSNAIDAIEGSGKIVISSHTDSRPGFVEITVEDSGCGMSEEELSRIFEPFYSTKNLDVRNGVSMVGNGLGLWNVYNLVTGSGGDLRFTSEKGKGTLCSIFLPLFDSFESDSDSSKILNHQKAP